MSTAITLFDQQKLPAHVAAFYELETNVAERVTVPSLIYEGKVWTISLNGEKTQLMRRNEEGDEIPIPVMRVVILDYAKRRGRALYEGAYDPGKPGKPLCWSDDGIVAGVTEPTTPIDGWTGKCEGCPMSIKGSKITDQGKAISACSQHRMLAVVPAHNLEFTPLRMKIAITSDYDGQSPDLEAQGWYAFNNLTDFMRKKGVMHTASLVTKMRFDPNVPYPKIIFSPDRWLTEDEIERVAPVTRSDGVKALLSGTWTPTGADGEPVARAAEEAAAKKAAQEAEEVAVKKAALEAEKAAEAAKKAAAAKKPVGKTISPQKAAEPFIPRVALDDDDEAPVLPVATKAAPTKVSQEKKAEPPAVPAELADLLSNWGAD